MRIFDGSDRFPLAFTQKLTGRAERNYEDHTLSLNDEVAIVPDDATDVDDSRLIFGRVTDITLDYVVVETVTNIAVNTTHDQLIKLESHQTRSGFIRGSKNKQTLNKH